MRLVTHNGNFHLDDIFAVATIRLMFGDVEVQRTRDEALIQDADVVVDVGGVLDVERKRFDHHQEGGAGKRVNGIPYAAFGLVWKEYGEAITSSKEVAQLIDSHFVQGIDAIDNGVEISELLYEDVFPASLQDVVILYRPTWKEEEGLLDENFLKLVKVAETYLSRMIKVSKDTLEARTLVEEAYEKSEDKRVVVFDRAYPYQDVLASYSEPLFVVYPDLINNTWKAKAVRVRPDSFDNRMNFPEEWAGKRGEEFQAISGVNDSIFCHNARFLVVAKSKEGILALVHKALN